MSSAGPQSIMVTYVGFNTEPNGIGIECIYVATQPNNLATTGTFKAIYLPSDNIAQINNKVIASAIAKANADTGQTYNIGQVKIPNLT